MSDPIRFPEYELYDALGLAELIRKQEMSANEIFEIAKERIALQNPFVNAITRTLYEEAEAQLKRQPSTGVFAGVPFVLKDSGVSYANVPTTFGSRWLRDYKRDFNSELVQRYLNAGLVIIGKTNVPEFGLSPVTESQLGVVTANPWDLSCTAGGSSGGAAAAVASHMVPMAHGSDGGGSLRVPASCCGLFGLKPTRGRTPSGPDVGRVWQGLVTEHALTRSVRDSAALLDVTLGDDVGTPLPLSRPSESYLETMQRDPGKLRIAVIKEPYFQTVLDSDCVIAVDNSAQLCTELGHHVDESKLPIDTEELLEAFAVLMCAETSVAVEYFKEVMKRKPRSNELEFTTKMLARLGKHYTAEEFSWAMSVFDKVTRQVGKFHQDYDVILTPTLAKPPIKNKTFNPYQYQKSILNLFACLPTDRLFKSALVELIAKGFQFNPYNVLFNISGQPAMSVPLYWNRQNLPIGSQFAARFGDEKTLFQLARQLEKLRPWQHRIPAKVK